MPVGQGHITVGVKPKTESKRIEKLKDIIREESKKDFPEFEPRDWSAHYSCRSTFVKI